MSRPCQRCGAPHACNGIGPPLVKEQQWFCGPCLTLQPASQLKVAKAARDALDDPEILVR